MRNDRMMWAAAIAGALAWSSPALAQDATTEEQGTGTEQQQEGTGAGQTGQQGQLGDDVEESLQELHAINQAEIQLARTAQDKAQSSEVKQFAQKMVQDHQKGDQQLQKTAQGLGIQLEGEKYQEALKDHRDQAQRLQEQRGAAFDLAFMGHMVRAHGDALDKVHETATKAGEQGSMRLAQALGQTEAALHGHHAQAQQIHQKLQQQAQAQQGTGAAGEPMDPAAPGAPGGALPEGGQEPAPQPDEEPPPPRQ